MTAVDDKTACILRHHTDPARPRAAAHDLLVCQGHYLALERYVDEAPKLDRDLLAAYTASSPHGGDKVTSSTTPGLNLRDDVLEARTWLRQVYRAWTRHVATSRHLTPPTADASIAELAAALRHHIAWLAAQYDVADLHDDLTSTVQHGRRIVAPGGARTFRVADCPDDIACDAETREGVPCAGTLQATLYPEDPSLPSTHVVVCNGCGKSTSVKDWLKLGRRVEARKAAAAAP